MPRSATELSIGVRVPLQLFHFTVRPENQNTVEELLLAEKERDHVFSDELPMLNI
jgi:hypothetical protein